jgi:hypothetical protein
MGYGENVVRLPLTPLEKQYEEGLYNLLKAQGISLR